MADLDGFKFDVTDETEVPEVEIAAKEVGGAPQFRPDFGDLSPAVSAASRKEEPASRGEFRMPLTPEQLPEEWKPVGAWKFWGYSLLFALPLIGFICAFVCAFAAKNLNVKGYARSYFCWLLIGALVIGGLVALAFALGWIQSIDLTHICQNDIFNLK